MPNTICPIAWKRGRCRNARCRLRHDIVQCGPCRCFVLPEGLKRHRRGQEHRQNCGFSEWKAQPSPTLAGANPPLPYPRVLEPSPRKPARSQVMEIPTSGRYKRSGEEQRIVVSGENGLTFKSTAGIGANRGRTFTTVTATIVIERVVRHDSLTLADVKLTGTELEPFSTTVPRKLPMRLKWKKPRRINVSFLPDAPGERNAVLALHFVDRTRGQRVIITRRLRGVAIVPHEDPRPQPLRPPSGGKANSTSRTTKRSKKKGGGARRATSLLYVYCNAP